ncbi:MAG: hypothetical protein IJ604_01295 [Prevotella sp.]|nr:hypothetical protein [Prevotella sp.]
MIQEEVTKFMALAPLMLPSLIGKNGPDDTDITDDSAILFFSLEERLPIGLVMDDLDDGMELTLLYHGTGKDNPKLHHCCFFASPVGSQVLCKFNLVTDGHEMVDGLNVTVYDSLDTFESDLEADLSAHGGNFDFIQAMKVTELLSLFCTMQ